MKALSLEMILTSASTRSDGSLGLRFSTPELGSSEKTTVFELLNQNLKVLIQPTSEAPESLVEVKSSLGFKTPGQRLRAVLFIAFQQQKPPDQTFDEFYVRYMEQVIDRVKASLT